MRATFVAITKKGGGVRHSITSVEVRSEPCGSTWNARPQRDCRHIEEGDSFVTRQPRPPMASQQRKKGGAASVISQPVVT